MKKVLVACEESQTVTIELRKLGIIAYSCDIIDCSGNHPEWHIKNDVTEVLKEKWDALIAFPPCTHLASSGAKHFKKKIEDGRQQEAIDFFMQFVNYDCDYICIENPIGIMSTKYRKPDQIIQPYQFGEPFKKTTCLWLKGLTKLRSTDIISHEEVEKGIVIHGGKRLPRWYSNAGKDRARKRSKTFVGIAKAMAEQWEKFLK